MAQYSRDFSADTIGVTPADFTPGATALGTGTAEVEAFTGATGDQAFVIRPQSGNRHVPVRWDTITGDADRDDIELLMRFQTTENWAGFYEGAAILGRLEEGTFVLASAYGAGLSNGGHTHYAFIGETTNIAGNLPEIATAYADPGFVPAQDTWYWVRLRINGTTLSAWFWEDGDPVETNADTPDITITDATLTTGTAGIMWDTNSGQPLVIDFISAGTNGDAAPSPSAGVPPDVTDVDTDESFASDAAGVTFAGTDLGADETARTVTLEQGAVVVEQTQGTGNATSGDFDVVGWELGGLLRYGESTNFVVETAEGTDPIAVTVVPPTGFAYVVIDEPHPDPDVRIESDPDLESGDQIEYDTVGGKVEVFDDGTFTVDDETVTEFDFRVHDGIEWGDWGTVTIEIDDGTTPDPFSFTDETDVALGATITSDPVTISGLTAPSAISVTGGLYSVNGGAFTASAGTVNDGDLVRARVTSSASYTTGVSAIVTIGGVSDTFTATTRAQLAPTIVTTSLPNGYIDIEYEYTLTVTGDGPFTFAVTAGALPDGLTLDTDDGIISGTPTTEETADFTITATNAVGNDPQVFTLNILDALVGTPRWRILVVSAVGRKQWIDYIPVKQVTPASLADIDTYNDGGAIPVQTLASGSGLTEWVDYIPVVLVEYAVAGRWTYNDTGYVPVVEVAEP